MPKNDFRQKLGRLGEKLAAGFLSRKGYRLVDRNFLIAGGQIDLIMNSPQGNLVFVEVKTRRAAPRHSDELRLGQGQIRALKRAARTYLSKQPQSFRTWQFDLIWINLDLSAVPQPVAKIKHFQNILEI
jgi:putative endonuclease